MGRRLKIALVLCTAAAGSAHAAAYVATSPGLDGVNHRILAAHNSARADVGAPPLQWDPALAVAAASYGPALSRAGRLVHSPRAEADVADEVRGRRSPGALVEPRRGAVDLVQRH